MIVIINGPCGIGKTSVAWELIGHFDRAMMLDGDYVQAIHPFEIYDEARITYLYQTLAHLVGYHMEQGSYTNFVINYVFETPESLAKLRHMIAELDAEVYAYRLVASDEAIAARIRQREQASDASMRWHLKRFKELIAIQDEASARGDMGLVIDTSNRSAVEVADAIWEDLHEAVEVVPYDPAWPDLFEEERAAVAAALGDLAQEIHHVGSTAIPGLSAKPIIDIAVVVRHLDDAIPCIAPLQALGYAFVDYPENTARRFFRKGKPRTHHLHIVAAAGKELANLLDFGAALRADPDLLQQYQDLKHRLAVQYQRDRAKYSKSKGDLIRGILETWRGRQ